MKIAVITPYYQEPLAKLQRCHDSVARQVPEADHIMVADGQAQAAVDEWNAVHLKLPVATNDCGDTPRMIGLSLAAARGYDAFLFLDADNWLEPGHVAQLVAAQQESGASVITCPRILRRLDGSALGLCPESDGIAFNDFNCYLFTRAALPLLAALAFGDRATAYVTDRRLWQHLRSSGCAIARAPEATLNYETKRAMHYQLAGETPPPYALVSYLDQATGQMIDMTIAQWRAFCRANPHLRIAPVETALTGKPG